MNQTDGSEKQVNAQEKLLGSLKAALDEAENFLREASLTTGDRATELRDRALDSLKNTRESFHQAQDDLLRKGRKVVRETDDYVHDNPWQAIAIAGGVGLLLGLLLSRR